MKLLEETKESLGYRGVFFFRSKFGFFLMREEANSENAGTNTSGYRKSQRLPEMPTFNR